jgi:hypothetical protein
MLVKKKRKAEGQLSNGLGVKSQRLDTETHSTSVNSPNQDDSSFDSTEDKSQTLYEVILA